MFVPFISKRSNDVKNLYRRKGVSGGKSSGSSSSGAKSSSSEGESSTGSTGAKSSSASATLHSISAGGTSKTATNYGPGGGKSVVIPAGQLFSGRDSGGGTRSEVFGTAQYGSGYPGVTSRGVAGRGFPFIFWPLAWGGVGGISAGAYLHTSEYGRPDNSSRPGGALATATFVSSSNSNTTFRLLADNVTVVSIIPDIQAACASSLNNGTSSFIATPYNDSFSALPQPEQTVQYYRASTVALTLDGYNNTSVFEADGTQDVPLPTSIDTTLLSCLNSTIGAAIPLVGGVPGLSAPNMGILSLFYVIWTLSALV